jgi:hypothetical protein
LFKKCIHLTKLNIHGYNGMKESFDSLSFSPNTLTPSVTSDANRLHPPPLSLLLLYPAQFPFVKNISTIFNKCTHTDTAKHCLMANAPSHISQLAVCVCKKTAKEERKLQLAREREREKFKTTGKWKFVPVRCCWLLLLLLLLLLLMRFVYVQKIVIKCFGVLSVACY